MCRHTPGPGMPDAELLCHFSESSDKCGVAQMDSSQHLLSARTGLALPPGKVSSCPLLGTQAKEPSRVLETMVPHLPQCCF